MVAPIDDSCRTYVLLSSLDETVVQHDQTFNLALHRFKGVYEPRGHKYITDFEYTPTPTITYRVGGVILKKEMLWIHKRTQLMIRYTLVDAHSETRLRLRPFLAFRDKHALTHANMEADGHSYPAVNGVKCRLYNSFPWLYLQTSKPGTEFVPAPDWYYGFEYQQELARGYEGYEDLLTTGYFEAELKKGESIIFSASLDEMGSTKTIEEVFAASIARRTHKIDFISCLEHSARQFLIRRPGDGPKWCRDIRGTGFRAARPSSRCRASRSNRDTRRTASTRWIRWCGRCATACSPAAPRPKSRRTPPSGFSGPSSSSNAKWGPRRYGRATARP